MERVRKEKMKRMEKGKAKKEAVAPLLPPLSSDPSTAKETH